MLTVISGNNRNGYPCALNKVGDIFQRGIPPFETEGLADVGDASQKGGFPLAGPLSLIFSSTKVTASEESKTYAGVTVSMTSRESKTYANLSSPESGSAKYSQRRSSMQGLRTDNLLNIKAESAFVQAVGKEKGPAVSQALLSTLIISSPRNSQGLEHNLPLQAIGNLFYSRHQHPNKTGAGFSIPNFQADIRRYKRFFFVRNNQRCAPIMVGRSGGALALAGFLDTGMLTLLRLATPFSIGERGSIELIQEAAAMVATTQTRPEFIDTYWIIPEYETTPYGKVSLSRQDRRTFIAMFKNSRLIWAGRQRVKSFTQGLKDPKSQKVDVKRSANPTSSTKGTESRLQFNQSPGLLVRKMPHEGKISIPQGMVNITPPSTSTITEIVTVPATVAISETVQGVAHA